jgi:hypothetical protein
MQKKSWHNRALFQGEADLTENCEIKGIEKFSDTHGKYVSSDFIARFAKVCQKNSET